MTVQHRSSRQCWKSQRTLSDVLRCRIRHGDVFRQDNTSGYRDLFSIDAVLDTAGFCVIAIYGHGYPAAVGERSSRFCIRHRFEIIYRSRLALECKIPFWLCAIAASYFYFWSVIRTHDNTMSVSTTKTYTGCIVAKQPIWGVSTCTDRF